jgi:hypothetical protein
LAHCDLVNGEYRGSAMTALERIAALRVMLG